MINFGSLAAVDIIANYSLLCVYLAGVGDMESAYLKPLLLTISGQSAYVVPASISHYTTTVQYIL